MAHPFKKQTRKGGATLNLTWVLCCAVRIKERPAARSNGRTPPPLTHVAAAITRPVRIIPSNPALLLKFHMRRIFPVAIGKPQDRWFTHVLDLSSLIFPAFQRFNESEALWPSFGERAVQRSNAVKDMMLLRCAALQEIPATLGGWQSLAPGQACPTRQAFCAARVVSTAILSSASRPIS